MNPAAMSKRLRMRSPDPQIQAQPGILNALNQKLPGAGMGPSPGMGSKSAPSPDAGGAAGGLPSAPAAMPGGGTPAGAIMHIIKNRKSQAQPGKSAQPPQPVNGMVQPPMGGMYDR